jgi:AcrR family transcriptional regulator
VADVIEKTGRAPGRPREASTDQSILEAALSLLEEDCYSYITFEKIAARAGVGKPTIYRRWKTKADLVLDAYAQSVAARAPAYLPSGDAFADLQAFLERLFVVAAHPTTERILRCFILESQFDEEFRAKYYDKVLRGRREAIAAILRHGQALGQVRRDVDFEVAADLIYGAFAARMIHGAFPMDAAFAAEIVRQLRLGYGNAAAPAPQA